MSIKAFDTNNANDLQSLYANLVIKCYEVMEVTMKITLF